MYEMRISGHFLQKTHLSMLLACDFFVLYFVIILHHIVHCPDVFTKYFELLFLSSFI